jgi:hypothetical protein
MEGTEDLCRNLTAEIGMRRPVPFDAVPIMVCKNALKGCKKKGD